jgi:hypothetical protein
MPRRFERLDDDPNLGSASCPWKPLPTKGMDGLGPRGGALRLRQAGRIEPAELGWPDVAIPAQTRSEPRRPLVGGERRKR